MENRENLLRNLRSVKGQITGILSIMDEQAGIVAAFRSAKASIATVGLRAKLRIALLTFAVAYLLQNIILGAWTAALADGILMYLLYHYRKKKSVLKTIVTIVLGGFIVSMPIYAFTMLFSCFLRQALLPLLILALSFILTITLIRLYNRRVDEKNRAIARKNADLQQQYEWTVQRLHQQQARLHRMTLGWYPKDYCTLDAVNFYISAVQNFKADTMKEAVLLFDESQHRKKMQESQQAIEDLNRRQLLNQQAISRQLRFANMLSIVNLSLQSDTLDAVRQNTEAVRHGTAAVQQSGRDLRGAVDSLNRTVSGLRR